MTQEQRLLQALLKFCWENQQCSVLAHCRRTQLEIYRSLPVWDRDMGIFGRFLGRV